MYSARRKIFLSALILLILAILGLLFVFERAVAAVFNFWKFNEFEFGEGIDLGANTSFQFLFLCMLGVIVCLPLIVDSVRRSDKVTYKFLVVASGIYFFNALVLFFIVFSGLAYLYCGR